MADFTQLASEIEAEEETRSRDSDTTQAEFTQAAEDAESAESSEDTQDFLDSYNTRLQVDNATEDDANENTDEGIADYAFGSVDETVSRQFDDEEGGGVVDGAKDVTGITDFQQSETYANLQEQYDPNAGLFGAGVTDADNLDAGFRAVADLTLDNSNFSVQDGLREAAKTPTEFIEGDEISDEEFAQRIAEGSGEIGDAINSTINDGGAADGAEKFLFEAIVADPAKTLFKAGTGVDIDDPESGTEATLGPVEAGLTAFDVATLGVGGTAASLTDEIAQSGSAALKGAGNANMGLLSASDDLLGAGGRYLDEFSGGSDDIAKVSDDFTGGSGSLADEIEATTKEFENAFTGVTDDLGGGTDEFGPTLDDITSTGDEFTSVLDDSNTFVDDLSQSTDELQQSVDDLTGTIDDFGGLTDEGATVSDDTGGFFDDLGTGGTLALGGGGLAAGGLLGATALNEFTGGNGGGSGGGDGSGSGGSDDGGAGGPGTPTDEWSPWQTVTSAKRWSIKAQQNRNGNVHFRVHDAAEHLQKSGAVVSKQVILSSENAVRTALENWAEAQKEAQKEDKDATGGWSEWQKVQDLPQGWRVLARQHSENSEKQFVIVGKVGGDLAFINADGEVVRERYTFDSTEAVVEAFRAYLEKRKTAPEGQKPPASSGRPSASQMQKQTGKADKKDSGGFMSGKNARMAAGAAIIGVAAYLYYEGGL
ncbi:hypothetical protein [Haloarcula sp. Atlit-47R]|uniref:hypothetical protein n=1 Tax=Haloarcula sp. Atlit-47R TaxID=2282132 RepID=UPI0011C36642|nr:hypothetical protein [Haloarcula sp. Atlit-47R]